MHKSKDVGVQFCCGRRSYRFVGSRALFKSNSVPEDTSADGSGRSWSYREIRINGKNGTLLKNLLNFTVPIMVVLIRLAPFYALLLHPVLTVFPAPPRSTLNCTFCGKVLVEAVAAAVAGFVRSHYSPLSFPFITVDRQCSKLLFHFPTFPASAECKPS